MARNLKLELMYCMFHTDSKPEKFPSRALSAIDESVRSVVNEVRRSGVHQKMHSGVDAGYVMLTNLKTVG